MFEVAEAYERQRGRSSRILAPLFVDYAQNLRFPDTSFDRCLSLLVMSFIPDALKAVMEMRRVTRPGGVVATAMWDTTGGNELNDALSDAAAVIDPNVKLLSGTYGTAEELTSLWASAGHNDVQVKNIVFACGFDSFNDFWQPLTEGQGPAGAYLRRISQDHRTALRERLRQNLFRSRTDGPFTLNAKAWAVRGTVP